MGALLKRLSASTVTEDSEVAPHCVEKDDVDLSGSFWKLEIVVLPFGLNRLTFCFPLQVNIDLL